MTPDGPIEIAPLTGECWPALEALFSAGGDPRWCWCMFWRKPGSSWANANPDENRRALRALADREPAPGLVALRDGVAVGWVGLGPRDEFPRLARSRTLPQLPGEAIWAVNCFVVARTARRTGIASALLAAAVDYATARGARVIEGYPVAAEGARIASASVYTGTLSMFERAGFRIASDTTSKPARGVFRKVVRLDV